jgi:DNA-binding transcriptional LysR family regulator
VALTDAGRVFLEDVRDILEQTDLAVKRARDASSGIRGHLRVGTIGTMTLMLLPKVLPLFSERYPEIEVSVQEMNGDEQVLALRRNDLDLGFTGRILVNTNGVQRLHVARFPLLAAVPKIHRLSTRKVLQIEDLADEPLVYLSARRAPAYMEWVRDLFTAAGVKPHFRRRVESIDSLLSLVAAGYGLAVLPKAKTSSVTDRYKMIPLAPGKAAFDLYAIWLETNQSATLRNFLEVLRSEAEIG